MGIESSCSTTSFSIETFMEETMIVALREAEFDHQESQNIIKCFQVRPIYFFVESN